MGPIFDPQIPKHGSIFVKITRIFWARNASPENFQKIPKHGSIFWAKSLNMGTFFSSKHGLGSRAAHPRPSQSRVPPPGCSHREGEGRVPLDGEKMDKNWEEKGQNQEENRKSRINQEGPLTMLLQKGRAGYVPGADSLIWKLSVMALFEWYTVCDVIKQNESALPNKDFEINPNKADTFFFPIVFGTFNYQHLWNLF